MEESEVNKENRKDQGSGKQGFKKKWKSSQKNNHPMPMNVHGTTSALSKMVQKCMWRPWTNCVSTQVHISRMGRMWNSAWRKSH